MIKEENNRFDMIVYSQKYYIKYNQICTHYKNLDLKKSGETYTESHHIIPKSMGGDNSKDNLVRVPARVHFLLHWMLYRIYKTPSMAHAWNMMCCVSSDHSDRYISKSYEYGRAIFGSFSSARMKGNALFSGKNHTQITRKILSEHGKLRLHSEETKNKISNSCTGKQHSEETKRKMSIDRTGFIHSEEAKDKIRNSKLGKSLSEEHKEKIRLGAKRRQQSNLLCNR